MKRPLTIRNLLHLIHAAVAILVVAMAVSVGLLFANQEKLIESERLRLESDRLGNEGDLSGANALFDEVSDQFPRVRGLFDQFLQTVPNSSS